MKTLCRRTVLIYSYLITELALWFYEVVTHYFVLYLMILLSINLNSSYKILSTYLYEYKPHFVHKNVAIVVITLFELLQFWIIIVLYC